MPVVLLFGDDYQLMPIISEGAIQGYHKMTDSTQSYVCSKNSPSQLFTYQGTRLFVETMTENVFILSKNYRVENEEFRGILERLRVGHPTAGDAKKIMRLHLSNYEGHTSFLKQIYNDDKTMWLFPNNAEKDNKNNQMLRKTSSSARPVCRLGCHYDCHRRKGGKFCLPSMRHFHNSAYIRNTDICVGARVAITPYNILPEVGLYNGAYGKVVDIVYSDRPVGPNDKQNYHLPDYVVVDVPHIRLPPHIEPWDKKHPTVSSKRYVLYSSI